VSQLIFRHGVRVVDLVAENQERYLGQIFHGEEGVEFGLGLGEAFVIFGIDEEYDSRYFGKVVAPKAASYTRERN